MDVVMDVGSQDHKYTCWVTSLNHELLYHSVEYVSIEVTVTSMNTKVFHSFGTTATAINIKI